MNTFPATPSDTPPPRHQRTTFSPSSNVFPQSANKGDARHNTPGAVALSVVGGGGVGGADKG